MNIVTLHIKQMYSTSSDPDALQLMFNNCF